MNAAFPIAWREARAAWRRLLPLLLCLAVGVGAVVMVGSFAESVRAAISERTRGLLAADLQVSSSAPIDRAVFPTLAEIERTGGDTLEITEFLSVVVPVGQEEKASLLTEVKAVDAGYPLVGALKLADGSPAGDLPRGDAVLVEQSLLARLNLKVGDELRFGTTVVRIAGVVGAEPDRALETVALGPRVLVDRAILPTTGLLDRGSRATYRVAVRLPDPARAEEVKAALMAEGKATTIRVRTAEDAQSALRRAIDRMERTLVTVALAVLLLAGAGIALTVRLHVLQRLDALAVLRAIGASRGQLTGSVLLQAAGFGLAGSMLGAGLGLLASRFFPQLVERLLPEGFVPVLSFAAVGQGVVLGLAATIAFALPPALFASRVSPLTVLRRSPVPRTVPRRPMELLLLGATAAAFLLVLILTVGSWLLALQLVGVLIALVLVLQLLAAGYFAALRKIAARTRSLVVREGLLHPTRSPRAAATVLTTLTLGALLVGTVGLVERNLVDSLTINMDQERPNLYLIGVRGEQREAVSEALGGAVEFEPVVRARVYAVDGKRIERGTGGEGEDGDRRGRREYGITSRAAAGTDEKVVEGRFWGTPPPATPEVSVEQEDAAALGIRIGSTVTFDILGTQLAATATSIRTVDWESGRPNYVFVLSPGALDGAPTTYFGALRLPPDQVAVAQAKVAAVAPNASAFDISLALGIIADVLGQIAAVVEVLAALVVAVGLVLLGGMVASTRAARVRETAILRTVGAKARQILRMLLIEYGVLGLGAGLTAAVLAEIASYVVATYVLELEWIPFTGTVLLGLAAFVLLTVSVGVLAALPVLRVAPLRTLREE